MKREVTVEFKIDELKAVDIAEKLWRNSRGAYELYPVRFEPENIVRMGNRTLRAFVKRLGARFSTTGVSTWKKISTVLLNKYEGNPRNITRQSLTIKEIKKRLNELDIPVDMQVARFTIYSGVLKLLSDRFEGCVHENPLRGLIEEAGHFLTC